MIGNFLILEIVAESTAKGKAAQQRSLDSLAKIVLGNRRALEYLLAERGGVYLCCVYHHLLYLDQHIWGS